MDAARWKQIDDLVDAARELSADKREQFVTERSGDDVDLRKKGIQFYKLTKQMRIQAGEEYVHFIDAVLNQRKVSMLLF